jgi:hypothetical protein
MAFSGASGVDRTLCILTVKVGSKPTTTKSVKVPPASMPIIILTMLISKKELIEKRVYRMHLALNNSEYDGVLYTT